MDDFAEYVATVGLRFIQPETPLTPEAYNPIALALADAGFSLDVLNTVLPDDEAATRARLDGLAQMPLTSTFAIAAIVNRAVRAMPAEQAFVNVGVWHGYTLFAGMVGNPDRTCIGVDDFSDFGAPRWTYRILLDRRTSCNGHPTLWNGLMVLRREGRRV